jgi:hypothetical protein
MQRQRLKQRKTAFRFARDNTDVSSTTLPGGTTGVESWVYETITSLCPVTETKTISGEEVTVTYTTTSEIVTQVPTTVKA